MVEKQYIQLIKNVLINGTWRPDRNGKVYSYFGNQIRFSLKHKTLPILTTKQLAYKTCIKELFWFIGGHTSNTWLTDRNVHIWSKNANGNDDLGPIYGYQWRSFNGKIDQLDSIVKSLQHPTEKYSRRLILTAWNPLQLHQMALPPCHILSQFYVNKHNELSCSVYQRSGDIGLGIPFNITSYATLTHLLAHHCHLKTGELIINIGDAHIYPDHIGPLQTQIKRKPYPFPKIDIKNTFKTIDEYSYTDIKVIGYKSHPKIYMNMTK